jgi:hypothetical protein
MGRVIDMASPLPLILAAAAAVLVLGGKKKSTSNSGKPVAPPQPVPDTIPSQTEEQEDEPPPPNLGSSSAYGTVSSGLRRDRLGSHAWRITSSEDGYRARLLVTSSRFSPVKEELGIVASENAARRLLSDELNKRLLAKYPNEKAKSDPPQLATIVKSSRIK